MTLLAEPPVAAPEPEAPAPPTRGPRHRWWQGWRVPFRLARRDVARRPGRTLLVVLLMALPVAVMTLIDVSYRTTQANDGAWIPRLLGRADAVAQFGAVCDEGCVPKAIFVNSLPEGTQSVWLTMAGLPLRVEGRTRSIGHTVTNGDVTQPLLDGMYSLSQGRWPTTDDEVAMTDDAATTLGVALGDRFELAHQTRTFHLVGIMPNDLRGWMSASVVAPGFDFSVVRPDRLQEFAALALPDEFDARQANWPTSGQIFVRPGRNGVAPRTASEQVAVNQSLVFGWLAGVLAMSVLGVIVASAFAVSGRRQLVAIGQLSAGGADRRTLSRTFALQGGLSGALGAGVGLLFAWGVHLKWPDLLGDRGPAVIVWRDVLVVALTAIGVAVVAALVPTRNLTRSSVLAALAGRRPVGIVPTWVVRLGSMALIGGLLVCLMAVRAGVDGGGAAAGMLVVVGVLASVLGICALSPVLIDRMSSLVVRAPGALRLAARSIGRHRARSAAMLASLLMVGIAASGVAAVAEARIEENAKEAAVDGPSNRNDVIWVQRSEYTLDGTTVVPFSLDEAAAERAAAARIFAGDIRWISAAVVLIAGDPNAQSGSGYALVVTTDLAQLFGISAADLRSMERVQGVVYVNRFDAGSPGDQSELRVAGLLMTPEWGLVAPSVAASEGWTLVPDALEFGVLDHEVTLAERQGLDELFTNDDDGLAYLDSPPVATQTSWGVSGVKDNARRVWTANEVRGLILGTSLIVVMLLIIIGMALWAVEGRDERDVLVAVGASPAALARVAAWRSGGLTFGAMVVAVPAGVGIAWAITAAADGHIVVPWLLGVLLVAAVPLTIGLGALASSAIAQRMRPVRMSSLTTD